MDEVDYESLPETSTLTTHLVAGAAAGIMEHVVMYPVDCVKTRMQILVPDPRANYRNIADALYRIRRYEGIKNTLRGINAVVYGAGPAHAMYFACYEKVKKTLSTSGKSNHLVHGFAGSCATVLHDAVMNPADVVKQRMQVYNSVHKTCLSCAQTVWQQEGFRAFYRSYITQLTMNIPFQALHFMFYELCQDKINAERQYNPRTHMISGGIAGAIAATATTPLDVCKTLLNTQESCAGTKAGSAATVNGLTMAVKTIYRFRGFRGFFQGVTARVVYVMPGTAISWSVYEFFKYFISQRQGVNADGYVSAATSPVQVHAALPSSK